MQRHAQLGSCLDVCQDALLRVRNWAAAEAFMVFTGLLGVGDGFEAEGLLRHCSENLLALLLLQSFKRKAGAASKGPPLPPAPSCCCTANNR